VDEVRVIVVGMAAYAEDARSAPRNSRGVSIT
jgi:hypothetical protein